MSVLYNLRATAFIAMLSVSGIGGVDSVKPIGVTPSGGAKTMTGSIPGNDAKISYQINSLPVNNVKLRIGNPSAMGLLVVVMSQAEPTKIKSIQYAPPKLFLPENVSSYFGSVVEQYVLLTDLVALMLVPPAPPVFDADMRSAERQAAGVKKLKEQVPQFLKEGKMTIWRIASIYAGINNASLTKVYVTLAMQGGTQVHVADKVTRVTGGIPTLVPNTPVQSNFVPEISFAEWKQPAFFNYGAKRVMKEPVYVCERFGTCSLDTRSQPPEAGEKKVWGVSVRLA